MKINQTVQEEFILVGFSVYPHAQTFLFVVFFFLYLLTLTGNLAIMSLTWVDRHLHTPMYLFFSALSFSEICYALTIIPKISFLGLAGTNCFILTLMGYDRFLAICNPLRYPLLMSNMACGKPVAAGFFISVTEPGMIFRGSFCSPNLVKHFFCHMRAVVRLSCLDSELTEFIVTAISVSGLIGTFLLIILIYVFIVTTQAEVLSTCASHLTVVIIHFGFASIGEMTHSAIPYTVITPFFSPLIFSLRNKDMKNVFRKALGKTNSLNK
uniref:G-protein coupled receptors family 1 profile domain-containing protein n=1 Tax=Capra hircus TaxID=9925 RepID=A0A452FQB4_CAPHI